MPAVNFPEAAPLKSLLADLLGKDLVFAGDATPPDPQSIGNLLAVYVGKDDAPLMLAGGDKAFAYLSGAALALVPKGRAEDAINGSEVDEDLLENYREILNVVTRAVNDQGRAHVRLVPGSVVDLSALPATVDTKGYTVQIDGYGNGDLFFWRF